MNCETKTHWLVGKRDALVGMVAIEYDSGAIVAAAESDRLTKRQFTRALDKLYPGRIFHYERRPYEHAAHSY